MNKCQTCNHNYQDPQANFGCCQVAENELFPEIMTDEKITAIVENDGKDCPLYDDSNYQKQLAWEKEFIPGDDCSLRTCNPQCPAWQNCDDNDTKFPRG